MTSNTQQKRRARQRNEGNNNVSTGITKLVEKIPRTEWEDIADEVTHGVDIIGKIQDVRMLANRSMLMSVVVPVEYAHEALALGIQSQACFTMLRAYHVMPESVMLPADDDDEDDQ